MQKLKNSVLHHISWSLHGSVNTIWTVACILCYFLLPLIQKNSAAVRSA